MGLSHAHPPTRILILGDALFDREIYGVSTRRTPDSHAPIVEVSEVRDRAGGAGLLARLVHALDAEICLATGGSATELDQLRAMLPPGIRVVALNEQARIPVKTRLWAGGEVIARIDSGVQRWLDEDIVSVPESLDEFSPDVVVVSDYGLGSTGNPQVRDFLKRVSAETPVLWDPHPLGAAPVPDCLVVTPNVFEVGSWEHGDPEPPPEELTAAANAARDRWSARSVALTMGHRGVLLLREADGSPEHLPVVSPVTDADACGAGDCFAAHLAVAVARGQDIVPAIRSAMDGVSSYLRAGGVRDIG